MDLRYSIDMVRLKTEIPVQALENFVLKPFSSEPGVNYKMMTAITAYRHNFYIEDYSLFGEKCSFWVGASHNARKHSDHVDIVLEYNPSKCTGSSILDFIFDYIFTDNAHVEIKSLDVAVDIPCNILDISISQSGNMNRRIFDNGADDRTYYFRKGKSNGALKIYNKKRESKLDYELTRYEITLTPNIYIDKIDMYKVPEDVFIPVRCVSEFQVPMSVKGTDKILLLSCMEHPEYLRELDSRKRKKIEQLLAENCSIDFDYVYINKMIYDFFKTIYTL